MFNEIEKIENENMASHTTLHINANARWFLFPKDELELQSAIYECRLTGIEYFILGGGSNLLVSDDGFEGAVISMKKFNKILSKGNGEILVEGGVNLFALNAFCAKNGFAGLEWSYGIPASVGGACKMNAGAYGGEFCNYVKEITIFNGVSIKKIKNINYGYRKGCLKQGEILISAMLKLEEKDPREIIENQQNYLKMRKEKQPYGEFSLGSVFKKGKDFFPAKLIEEFGFKNLRRGGMVISEKHSGFIINDNNGTSKDFLYLVDFIECFAKEKGYFFEREFITLGIN